MKYAISVKLDTLTCTRLDFENVLKDIGNYLFVNDSLWLFEGGTFPFGSPESIFFNYFEKFTNENSHILITQLSKGNTYYYELPDEAATFLDS